MNGARAHFHDDLDHTIAAAESKLDRVLGTIDRFIDETRMHAVPSDRRSPIRPAPSPTELDLRDAGIETVLWATGFRRYYDWLNVPVLDIRGELLHQGGVTPARGLYALGLNFQRTRNSSFIDGVGRDARFLADHITRHFHRSSIAA
jgi:putative flavoprotein involved in K+ transport